MKTVSFLGEPRWEACTLVSGSSGNAIYVSAGRTKLLIDAGVAAKRIEAALAKIGQHASELDAILLTHEHADHIRGAGPLARRHHIPIYTNARTAQALTPMIGNLSKTRMEQFDSAVPFSIGDFSISPFRISHDAAEPVGFRLDAERYSVSVCTDLGEMTDIILQAMSGSDLVFLESNYDENMLLSGTYPWVLKQRIRSRQGHLSNVSSGEAACQLVNFGTENIVLSHLSEENNFPALAELTVAQALREEGVKPDHDLLLQVAPRHTPGRLYQFGPR